MLVNIHVEKNSCGQNVLWTKHPVDKKSCGQQFMWPKSPDVDKKSYGQKMSVDKNSCGQKVMWTQRHVDKKSHVQKVVWTKNVRWTKIHEDKKSCGQKVLWTKSPVDTWRSTRSIGTSVHADPDLASISVVDCRQSKTPGASTNQGLKAKQGFPEQIPKRIACFWRGLYVEQKPHSKTTEIVYLFLSHWHDEARRGTPRGSRLREVQCPLWGTIDGTPKRRLRPKKEIFTLLDIRAKHPSE